MVLKTQRLSCHGAGFLLDKLDRQSHGRTHQGRPPFQGRNSRSFRRAIRLRHSSTQGRFRVLLKQLHAQQYG